MIRGLLAEFGIEMARGLHHALALAKRLTDGNSADVPELAERVITSLAHQVGAVQEQLARLERVDPPVAAPRLSSLPSWVSVGDLRKWQIEVAGTT